MAKREHVPISTQSFASEDIYEAFLREIEDEGHLITGIGQIFDKANPANRANWYEFVLPPSLDFPPSALIVDSVPAAARNNKDVFRAFIAPLLDSAELVDRAVVFIGGVDTEVVLLRPVNQTTILPSSGLLVGDGTWPWFAAIEGRDIVVFDAKTTAFGGGDDTADSGQTASGFPTKGHPELLGCALPMDGYAKSEAEHKALDGTPIPKMPFGIKKDGTINPEGAQVRVTQRSTGKSIVVPVIDLGPAKSTGHPLDLTVAAAKFFKPAATANNFGTKLDFRILDGAKHAPVVTPIAGGAGGFPQRLAASATDQYNRFHELSESDSDLSKQIRSYWEDIGFTFKGVGEAWSAVFVCWNIQRAGASHSEFQPAKGHAVFVNRAIKNAENGIGVFRARRLDEYSPKVGDIVHNNRNGDTFDYAFAAANTEYESHSAIVVEAGVDGHGPFVRTIGGNESDSIRRKRIALQPNGRIVQRDKDPYICIIENRKA